MTKKVGVIAGSVVLAVVVLVIALVLTSVKKIDSAQVGLFYNNFNKELREEPNSEGLYFGLPGFQFIIFTSVFKTMSYPDLVPPIDGVCVMLTFQCLNKDGVTIRINISFQYRVKAANLKSVVDQFKDEVGYDKILRYIGSSAVHDSCSRFNTSQFQAERGRFQEDLTLRLVDKLQVLHCDITDLQVNNIQRPYRYDNSIQAKESSREDIEVARNERPQKLTEAGTTKLEAETEAEIILNNAKSQARIMLTRAITDAKAILDEYTKEADSYRALKEANNLDTQGFLAYMGIRAISNAKNPVRIGMKAPAKSSYA
ncbi:hypothetical protein LSH36_107g08004 [Paralvinella palmiformis]|uniref:Band 7 domain-containing protein n=1 Tax=Paralvinella palmiformis TaxID=53620 RepID=A0AAD9K129_9ANNE|nr:hypothetical protein LSH36_107g08004 [Paralvinella palmiformis]